MTKIRTYQGKILTANGKIAISQACCCGWQSGSCCSNQLNEELCDAHPSQLKVTFDNNIDRCGDYSCPECTLFHNRAFGCEELQGRSFIVTHDSSWCVSHAGTACCWYFCGAPTCTINELTAYTQILLKVAGSRLVNGIWQARWLLTANICSQFSCSGGYLGFCFTGYSAWKDAAGCESGLCVFPIGISNGTTGYQDCPAVGGEKCTEGGDNIPRCYYGSGGTATIALP